MPDERADSSLLHKFEAGLSPAEQPILAAMREWQPVQPSTVYLVGGAVRDLLLDRQRLDLDLAVDGDWTGLAYELGARLAADVTLHTHFTTAQVTHRNGTIDLVGTRDERYAYPGALPAVEPAAIETDLGRRDFTIHALAVVLTGPQKGQLIDPFGGCADLRARLLRVLHRDGFRDDPTRLLRLARYSARLDFSVEAATRELAKRDGTFLTTVSSARVMHELERTFAEEHPEEAIRLMDELHALRAIFSQWRLPDGLERSFERLRHDGGQLPTIAEYLSAMLSGWVPDRLRRFREHLGPRQPVAAALSDLPAARALLAKLAAGSGEAWIAVPELNRLQLAAVRAAGAAGDDRTAAVVHRYLGEWSALQPSLRGGDILAMGVPPGPRVGELLRMLQYAVLRREVTTPEQERCLVQGWLAKSQAGER